jgi:DNA-binding response OmpR family regulator
MAEILLIDDDDELRQFLEQALTERGHRVLPLERADSAAEILADGGFDLVVVDELMPGISGSEFLKFLRDTKNYIPAILMTGLATSRLNQPMKELGAFVVPKPAGGFGELMKNLDAVLDEAMRGEAEIVASMGRTVNLALKLGKTGLVPYLRWLLDRELLVRVSTHVNHDSKKAKAILGVPLTELTEEKPPLSFRIEALRLIINHPELKVDQYADRLGCSRATLYRDPEIKRALKTRKGTAHRPPRGSKNAEGNLEAWDE